MSPPSKRRRLNASPALLAFLDLEAQAEDLSEEEEGEEDLGELIDDTIPDDEGSSLYSHHISSSIPDHDEQRHERLNGELDNAGPQGEDVEEEYCDGQREPTTYTQAFMRRIGGPSEGFDDDDERRAPGAGDGLWEIGCKVGAEEGVVFQISARLVDDSTLHPPIRSVIGRKTLPGRIYVETPSQAAVITLAQTVYDLNVAKIRSLDFAELLPVLIGPKPVYRPQSWRRILGPWKAYQGDLALIVKMQEQLCVIAVPRIQLYSGHSTGDRPPRRLLKVGDLEAFLGCPVPLHESGAFNYNGKNYLPEGYFLEYLHKAQLSGEVLPSPDELNSFNQCKWLNRQTYERTALLISLRNVKPHDRVKVVAGIFIDLVGQVVEVSENEVEVYLPSQDANERILLESVRPYFAIGDEVKLLDKEHDGITAWVVGIVPGGVKVANLERSLELTMCAEDVEFYSPPHQSTLRIRKLGDSMGIDSAGIDYHRRYIGRRVTAVGSWIVKQKHPYRGYHGTIKNTAADGSAWVELDALQQKVVKFDLDQLRLHHEGDMTMDIQPFRTFRDPALVPPGPSSSLDTNGADRDTRNVLQLYPSLSTPLPIIGTPMPTCSAADDVSPAWDPSARTPRPSIQVLSWLRDPLVTKARLEMVEDLGNGVILEFLQMHGDEARVRDGTTIKLMPIEALRAVLPTRKDDLVVPIVGDMRGVLFKIHEYADDICEAKQPAHRLKRGEAHPSFATVDLVQVFPPLNRRSAF